MSDIHNGYYTGPERRVATKPRRARQDRRHRLRVESMVSDCRSGFNRRKEDEDGFVEVSSLYQDNSSYDQE